MAGPSVVSIPITGGLSKAGAGSVVVSPSGAKYSPLALGTVSKAPVLAAAVLGVGAASVITHSLPTGVAASVPVITTSLGSAPVIAPATGGVTGRTTPVIPMSMGTPTAVGTANADPAFSQGAAPNSPIIAPTGFHAAVNNFLCGFLPAAYVPVVEYGLIIGTCVLMVDLFYKHVLKAKKYV